MDIEKLIDKAKTGDTEAFEALYDQHADRIFRYIRIKVQHHQQAEDLLQETFIKAWRALPRLEANSNFSAWVYKIAHNAINDHFRRVYRTPQMVNIDDEMNIAAPVHFSEDVSRKFDVEAIRKELDLLSPQHKLVLELRFVQDFTIPEVAAVLGKSQVAVRIIQHRALKKLKGILGETYDNEPEKI
jgi:RNA polymerase sigma-70 factor, ECF subfamily